MKNLLAFWVRESNRISVSCEVSQHAAIFEGTRNKREGYKKNMGVGKVYIEKPRVASKISWHLHSSNAKLPRSQGVFALGFKVYPQSLVTHNNRLL